MTTIIRYRYRRHGDPSWNVQGPVYIDQPDDGRSPEAQARDHIAGFGGSDQLVEAVRVTRPKVYQARTRP